MESEFKKKKSNGFLWDPYIVQEHKSIYRKEMYV